MDIGKEIEVIEVQPNAIPVTEPAPAKPEAVPEPVPA